MAVGTDIGEPSHIIRNGQARKAVASGQFARHDPHIARSQASRLTAVDLRAIDRDSELRGIDDLRRAVGDIVIVYAERGKAATICILACPKLYRIDTFIGICASSRRRAGAKLCGVQVLARLSRCCRGCCTSRIGPLIGRIAAGRRVRHEIRQRSAVYSHGLTILGTSACDRILGICFAIGTLTLDILDIDGQVDGGYGERMRAILDDIVVVVVVQHIEAMRLRRICHIRMIEGNDLAIVVSIDISRCQRDGAAGVRAVDIETVAVDFRLVSFIALDIGVPADLAVLAIAVLVRSGTFALSLIIFKRLQHFLDIILVKHGTCCLAIGE